MYMWGICISMYLCMCVGVWVLKPEIKAICSSLFFSTLFLRQGFSLLPGS